MRRLGPFLVIALVVGVAAPGAALAPAAPTPTATVKIFAPHGQPGRTCTRVFPLRRRVARPAVLAGAMRALVAGPTRAERSRGYGGWFSARTAGSVRSARVVRGVAYVDFRDFSHVISGASGSCGGALLLAQLDRTATQFANVKRAVYSFDGHRRAFYEWLQRGSPARDDV
jgi:sporulation and spore germination protein